MTSATVAREKDWEQGAGVLENRYNFSTFQSTVTGIKDYREVPFGKYHHITLQFPHYIDRSSKVQTTSINSNKFI